MDLMTTTTAKISKPDRRYYAEGVTLYVECEDCGHSQRAYVLRAVVEGDTLVDGITGSDGDYCQVCDGPVRPLGFEVEA